MAKLVPVREALALRADVSEPVLERISAFLDEGKMEVDVERIVLYVRGHLFQHRILDYLRRRLGLNDSAFYRFQRHFGQSVENFVFAMRVEIAKQMLRRSDMTITAISDSLGFDKARSFIAIFENRVGMRPTEFRDLESGA